MKIPDLEQWHFTVELVVNAQIQSGVKIYSPPNIYSHVAIVDLNLLICCLRNASRKQINKWRTFRPLQICLELEIILKKWLSQLSLAINPAIMVVKNRK